MSEEHRALDQFIRESNAIEGIRESPRDYECLEYLRFLALDKLTTKDVEQFVKVVADARLREREGDNVIVGSYRPPPGGPEVRHFLDCILQELQDGDRDPYEAHCAYENLHPFGDGNGRSGRVIWLWQMIRQGREPLILGFLHNFYYQALDHTGDRRG